MKDVPLLMIILQHLLEHLHSLRCDSSPTSRGNGTGWQGRSWEERIERRLVGHPSAEAGVGDASIDQFYTLSMTRRSLNLICHLGSTRAHLKQGVVILRLISP